MPDTVDDFMRRFASGGTVDDEDARRFHDRFVSTDPKRSIVDLMKLVGMDSSLRRAKSWRPSSITLET